MSKARGYIALAIEDFGIFPVEAISCGTPVIALNNGGYLDYVIEGVNGVYLDSLSLDSFRDALERFDNISWDYVSVRNSVSGFSRDIFIKKVSSVILKNI